MNLEDVISPEYGLQQDEWSLTKPRFGDDRQLEVVGWGGKVNYNKLYILICYKCSQDGELFGEGYFRSLKGSLLKGRIPCGCGRSPRWSKEQYIVLCSRKARELGYTFLGFTGEWKGAHTRTKMSCEKHGDWTGCGIDSLISKGTGCPQCGIEAIGEARIKPDSEMISSFFNSRAFHPDTKFWRSDRKNTLGWKIYWYIFCPYCGETGESASGDLQRGQRSCGCSIHRQKEAYINLVTDGHGTAIAVKFGIAFDSHRRIKQQDSKSVYTITHHSVYIFPDTVSCRKAETECKQQIECGVVLKRDMSDGYSETTWIYNLEKIEEIYKRNGGTRI